MLKEKPRKSQNNGIFAGRKSQTRVRGLFNNRTGVFLCQGSRPQTDSMSCKPVLQRKSLDAKHQGFFVFSPNRACSSEGWKTKKPVAPALAGARLFLWDVTKKRNAIRQTAESNPPIQPLQGC